MPAVLGVAQFISNGGEDSSTNQDQQLKEFDWGLVNTFSARSVSKATQRTYRKVVTDFFQFFKNINPVEVKSEHVIAFRDCLIEKNRSANTIALKLSIIRSFYSYLLAQGYVKHNPASTRLVSPPPISDLPAGRALTSKEVCCLLNGPDRATLAGRRDYALMLLMVRLSLRVNEACTARLSNIRWSHGRWIIKLRVKRGKEEMWPLPADVKQSIDDYLSLDCDRRMELGTAGDEQYIFQPHCNYRTREFAKPLSSRHAHKIVVRWAQHARIGRVSPHDLRRTVITKLLNDGKSYREVQMVTKHRDPRSVQRYDHARENLEHNPVNTLSYENE
jgi:site-specific recombinase XerD